ncbi:probable nucleoredoxin 2 isoform X2 [Durio zibethinus]|uniref:protein-disulfide reductase n=1 Tax=Durio zibethinus TaxID=66656 RepID=A0A6P5ZK12_DURZI|nr:probable nucleoredoxin 2 isoform X2 [Durio zibethinus]
MKQFYLKHMLIQVCGQHSNFNRVLFQVPVDSLIGKTVGLYFSEERCFPCVKFTPKLISVYQRIKQMLEEKGGEDFEIVFVSNDRDQSSFDSYFATMPWLALPFGDPTVKSLAKYFDVQGNPCLIIIGPDGKTITKQGRNLINLYQENAYPFTVAQVELLEKEIEEAAKSLPRSEYHAGHCHELTLVSEGTGGGPFICCDCDEQGSGWAYLCLECGYEVHPRCMRPVAPAGSIEGSKENVYWKLGRDVGIFSSPFFGHFNITFVSSLLN